MKIVQVHAQIYLCEARDHIDLNTSMVRLQEYYESSFPNIKGHYFTTDDFRTLYKNNNKGKYTYNEEWGGNNIPGHVIRDFYKTFPAKTRSAFETELKIFLNKRKLFQSNNHKKFYVIGIPQNHAVSFSHELAHAFFYIFPTYKKKMLWYMEYMTKKTKKKACKILKKEYGYTDGVLLDELQAYLATETCYWLCDRFDLKPAEINWGMVFNIQQFYNYYREKIPYLLDAGM
ncbi:MAG: hypothetical protein ACREBJ_13565 [Nitrosotalea sp.]